MATTEEVLQKTRDLLNRVKTEGVTQNGIPQAFSAESFNKALTAAQLPTVNPDTFDYRGTIAGGNAAIEAGNNNQNVSNPASNTGLTELFKQYLGQQEAPQSNADLYQSELQKSGITDSQKRLNDLQAQLAGINAEAQASELAMKGEGLNLAGANARNISRERELAIRALPLQAQIAAEQGNLNLAQDRLNTVYQLKVKDAENQYNYKQKLIDSVYDFATKQEQAQLDAKKTADTQAYNDRVNNLNQAQTWATTAIQQGQGDLAAQIMALDPKDVNYQTKLGQLAAKINAKITTNSTFQSGGLIVFDSAIAKGQQVLDSVRGSDNYVYTPKYLEMLKAWKDDGGLEQDFFKNYPPKNYLNPNDASVPKYIREMLKASTDREI